jgi:crotonobetainyl-CoA:carnitine CoA-transferase CaiB-like acyl-CoA transferase
MPLGSAASTPPPLRNVKVLDLSRYQAGPKAAMILADLGAEVIRAENPETERDGGFAGPTHEGHSIYYAVYNRGKKSIGLNRSHPEGRELFRKLIPHLDVIVENFRPGYLDRLGFSYEAMRAINKGLILVSISAYGQDGPYADQTGFCNVALAASGYMDVSGDPFSPLHQTGTSIADRLAGLHGAVGALGALVGRSITGEGRHVDVSLMDAALTMIEFPLATFLMTGRKPPSDVAARRAGSSPNQVFRARDGMVLINAPTQDQWLRLLHVMGRDDLAKDPRFDSPLRRQDPAAAVAIEALIGDWMRTLSVDEAYRALVAADVPAAPVRTIDQVATDPQVEHRRMVQAVRHPELGLEMRLTGNPVKLSGLRDEIGHAATRGEHNREIYGKWLGLDDDTIADLTRRKII